jgi:hypothetical protein
MVKSHLRTREAYGIPDLKQPKGAGYFTHTSGYS